MSMIIEIFTFSFFAASVAVGFFISAIFNYAGFNNEWQIYSFSIGVIVTFFAIRPLFNKIAYNSDKKATNQNAMIGKTAVVTENIDRDKGTGLVRLDGDIWKAKTYGEDIIEINQEVEIVNIDSIVIIVKLKE